MPRAVDFELDAGLHLHLSVLRIVEEFGDFCGGYMLSEAGVPMKLFMYSGNCRASSNSEKLLAESKSRIWVLEKASRA